MKYIFCIMFMCVIILCGCSAQENQDKPQIEVAQTTTPAVGTQQTSEPAESENQMIGQKIEALVSDKIDVTKRGVVFPELEFSSEISVGADGDCYYFRKRDGNIIFYKNDEEKVCKIAGELSGNDIESFAQYKEYIYVLVDDSKCDVSLFSVNIHTSKWKKIMDVGMKEQVIIYQDSIYIREDMKSNMERYNMRGKKIGVVDFGEIIEQIGDGKRANIVVSNIIDDKIYYVINEGMGQDNTTIMRCDLDGKRKEEIFTYTRKHTHYAGSRIVFADKSVYIRDVEEDFWTPNTCICRVPLYGGKVQRVVDGSVLDIALHGNELYYIDSKNMNIYCKQMNKRNEAKKISDVKAQKVYVTNDCLMVEGYNSKEREIIGVIDENDTCLKTDYVADYYWMTLKGENLHVIKGSGLKKADCNLYKSLQE